MKINFILAADNANHTQDGKLNVMGIFGQIFAVNFPARHPSMNLIMQLRPDDDEAGQTGAIAIRLIDPDGNEIYAFDGAIQIPDLIDGVAPQINVNLNFRDVPFMVPGPYEFHVQVNNAEAALPIGVTKLAQPI